MDNRTRSILSLAFVAFCYVLLNVSSRLLGDGFEPMTQVYLRIGLGTIIAVVVFRKKLHLETLRLVSKKDWLILFVMGTLGYSVAVYFITLAALNTNLLNISVILSTLGYFVYFYSIIFLKEKFKPIVIFLLLLSTVGVIFVAGKSFSPQLSSFGIGELFALIYAAFVGMYFVGRKLLSSTLNNQEITAVTMVIATVSSVLLALMKGEMLPALSVMTVSVLLGLILGAVLNIVATYLETFAFDHISPVLGNQVLLLESLFAVVIGFLFYHELVSFPELVGSALILASVYWSNKLL